MITGAISAVDNPFSDMFEDEESEKEYPIDAAFDRVSFFSHFLPLLPATKLTFTLLLCCFSRVAQTSALLTARGIAALINKPITKKSRRKPLSDGAYIILVQSLTSPQTEKPQTHIEVQSLYSEGQASPGTLFENSNILILCLYFFCLLCSLSFAWSCSFVQINFIIYTCLSITDHSKACIEMDIDTITVSFSNIASPSKQNPTLLANEESSVALHSSFTNRHGEYTFLISFFRDSKDHLICTALLKILYVAYY